jgi:hypothetical protein
MRQSRRVMSLGQEEPYEPRGSRTDLWERGGEIPPRHPTLEFPPQTKSIKNI